MMSSNEAKQTLSPVGIDRRDDIVMTKKLLENLGFLLQMGLCILPVHLQSFLA